MDGKEEAMDAKAAESVGALLDSLGRGAAITAAEELIFDALEAKDGHEKEMVVHYDRKSGIIDCGGYELARALLDAGWRPPEPARGLISPVEALF